MEIGGVMGWTHPICDKCWEERNPDRMPYRFKEPKKYKCCYCGKETDSGIFIRENAKNVKYPYEEEE